MSVFVVVTVYPIPEHRAEVVAALARLSACIWCHQPDLGSPGGSRWHVMSGWPGRRCAAR